MSVFYPTLDQMLEAQQLSIQQFGGLAGIRDLGLVQSALAQPEATFGGDELYPTVEEKAAALAFSLAKNHAFVDGNKRIALASLDLFLRGNGMKIVALQDEIVATILGVAAGTIKRDEFTAWVQAHTQPLP